MTAPAGVSSAFIAAHRPWVDQQAWRLLRTLPANVERADLVQVGLIAVWQCAQSFEDTGEPDAFKRYAGRRVKGAMLDELRRMDQFSRGERSNIKRLRAAPGRLSDKATAVGMTVDRAAALLHLSQSEFDGGAAADEWIGPPGTVEDAVDRSMSLARLERACGALSERESDVIDAYLGMGMTPIGVAEAHGVTPSRISQVFSGLLRRIARAMDNPPPPLQAHHREPEAPPCITPSFDLDELFSSDLVRGCTADLLTRRMG